MKTLVALAFFCFLYVIIANGHVRLRRPPNRSSIWRDPAFAHYNPLPNYDDDGLYCGRVHQNVTVTTCGTCGDPYVDSIPRANEHGGTYGRGIIVANYSMGQIVPIDVEFTTAHLGYFEMQLCERVGQESESCFNHLLPFQPQGNTRYPVPNNERVWVNTTIKLPPAVSCSHCVLRLHYRAGNNWGDCYNGTQGMGCGLQETFRSCADISIR